MTGGDPGHDLAELIARLRQVVDPLEAVGGWATVELDRAAIEVAGDPDGGPATGSARPGVEDAPDERILGARCRLVRFADGRRTVLLEPSTEGLLAAALARHAEGIVAMYLLADAGAPERARRAGFQLSSERPGPLGPERLVRTGPRWGPFLLLVGPA